MSTLYCVQLSSVCVERKLPRSRGRCQHSPELEPPVAYEWLAVSASKKVRTTAASVALAVSSKARALPTTSGRWKLACGNGCVARSSTPTASGAVKTYALKRRAARRWSASPVTACSPYSTSFMPPHSVSSTCCHSASPPAAIVASTRRATQPAILLTSASASAEPACVCWSSRPAISLCSV